MAAGKPSRAVWQLLDANANRAREGLRVIEDTARFVLQDRKTSAALRGLRHHLDTALRAHYGGFIEARNVEKDPGRQNASADYGGALPALVAANFKRVEEALRVLEEYVRLIAPESTADFQKIRFHVYGLEKMMHRKLRSHYER